MQRILTVFAAAALTVSLAACSSTKGEAGNASVTSLHSQGNLPATHGVAQVQADDAVYRGPENVARAVHFDFDSYTVRSVDRPIVAQHAAFIKAHKDVRVVLAGHTDAVGGREYNLALGQKRAEAVRQSLALLGVPDARMEAVSFGKERPVTEDGLDARNRRVEFGYK